MPKNKAFFLDRDGTINVDTNYLHQVSKVKLLPDIAEAIKLMHDNNYLVVVISNQGGLAKQLFNYNDLINVNNEIQKQLIEYNKLSSFDYFYYCPHHPIVKQCQCRKPSPYLINKASEQLNIDISQSFMIGDKISDVQCGINAKCKDVCLLSDKPHRVYKTFNNILKATMELIK